MSSSAGDDRPAATPSDGPDVEELQHRLDVVEGHIESARAQAVEDELIPEDEDEDRGLHWRDSGTVRADLDDPQIAPG